MTTTGSARRADGGVGPTVVAGSALTALVLSAVAFGVALADDDGGGAAAQVQEEAAPSTAPSGPEVDFTATLLDGQEARDPVAPAVPAERVHRLTIDVTEEPLEIAPGVTQLMWTFNGTVPGPVLRGRVGDTFEITLKNGGTLGHSIDFHASKVAWNDEMRTINTGEDLIYRFEAEHAGIFMYHCGTAPVLHHIGMGMYGAVIIDPPALPAVDREYVMVQSELYLAPDASQTADLSKMLAEQWDAVAFNGFVNQYRDRPIRVEPGERIRVWVENVGPSENSSWHVVGSIFDTVFKEGEYLLRPGEGRGGAQALDLQPAQGGFVEFTFDEAGLYPFVTHKFASASKGALGLFQAGEVEDTGGASE